jgi:hypothetical protein
VPAVCSSRLHNLLSNRGSRVGGVMAFGMRPSAPAVMAERPSPSGKSAASLATTVNFGRPSSRRNHAACGGGLTHVIVRRWTISIGHYPHHIRPRRTDKDEQTGVVRRAAPRLNHRLFRRSTSQRNGRAFTNFCRASIRRIRAHWLVYQYRKP